MSQLQLLKNPRFWPLFWTQFCGAFNDNFIKNALVILITYQSSTVLGLPSAQIVVLAGGIFILPFFLFSATAGQLADKYDKARIVRAVKVAEIGIMILATIGFVFHHFEFLLLVLFLMGLHSTVFGPVKYSILPQLVSDQDLVGGNALVEAGTFMAILVGTILGGILVGIQPNGPAIVSCGLLAISIVGWLTSLKVPSVPIVDPNIKVRWSAFAPTRDILRSARKTESVFLSIMGVSWFWFFGAAFLSLFPIFARDSLHANETVVTLFLSLFSVGIAVGSLLCEKMSRQRLELGLVPLGSLGMSIFAADLLFASGFGGSRLLTSADPMSISQFLSQTPGWRIVIDLFMLSVFSGFFIVPLYTLMQLRSDPGQRSRVVAANNIMNAIFMVTASLVLMIFVKMRLMPEQIFLILAVMNAAVSCYIYFLMPEFLLRFYAWIIASIMYRMRVSGHEHIPTDGPAVLVCNHVSFVDWLILAAGVKRPLVFVMDHSFYKGWLGRTILKQAKAIPIATAKENPKILEAAFESIARELAEGNVVCIFPEGSITRTGEMIPFRPGIEKIITRSPVPVVPMALRNLWGSFFSREGGGAIKKVPKRFWSAIELRIGEAVEPARVSAEMLQTKVVKLLAD